LHRFAALSGVVVVVLTGCSGGDNGSRPAETASEGAPVGTATCELEGEAAGTATLEQTRDGLEMTFTGLPVLEQGTALYSVTAYDAAGENGGQFGVKYQDGEQVALFVFDFGAAEQINLDGEAQTSADGITATAADAELGPLSGVEVASWSAAYTADGIDAGTCPGGIDQLPFP
jgi:hypothetical protein